MDLSPISLLLVGSAAVVAGLVNAVAGGGTLISFPMLTAVGVPTVSANVTNTIALSPGYLGGTIGQREDLAGQRTRLLRLIPAGMLGAIGGSVLLLNTSESIFRRIVPFLILMACGLLAGQDRVRRWVEKREHERANERHESGVGPVAMLAVFGAAIYGGYFGAGLGIILLAVLGVVVDDDFRRVNALKQAMSLTINSTAAARFLFSGQVAWAAAGVMAVGSLVGGNLGGRVASRVQPLVLRRVVIAAGVCVAIVYLVR